MNPETLRLRGWNLVGWTALAVGLLCAILLASLGTGREGLGAVMRWTARVSALLFFAAFSASSLARLRPGGFTRWLLANRRYVGVSFGVSHTWHLAAIAAWAARPETLLELRGIVFGGLAYVFLAAMVATSFDRSAAWLGARRWKLLHTAGGSYIWFIFTFTFAGSVGSSSVSAVFLALALATLGLRVAAGRARRAGAPA